MRRYITEKIRWMRRAGHRHLLIIPGPEDSVAGDDYARVYTVASPPVSKTTGYRALLRTWKIADILQRERPDIVENADPYQVGSATASACRSLRIPAVSFYHSHYAESELRPLQKWIGADAAQLLVDLAARRCRRLYKQFAKTLVPSPILAGTLMGWGVENTVVVDLGVDIGKFFPAREEKAAIRSRLKLPQDKRILLYVGRLAAEKNTALLAAAFTLLHRASPDAYHLLVAGEGLQRAAVERAQSATGAVTILPFLAEHAQLLECFHAADLFVHPGVQETFGLVAAEAQATALPVVGICGTSMDRVIGHDRTFWAGEETSEALAAAVAAAFQRDLTALGRTGYEATVSRFAWENVYARQFDLYAKLLHKEGRA